jgi:hypothetical protein
MIELKFGPPVFITEITEELRKNLLLDGIKQNRDARPQLAGHIEDEKMYSGVAISKFTSPILDKVKEYIEKIKIDRNTKDVSYKTTLNGLWINRQTSGEHNPPHRHSMGQISFVIYLDFPDEIKNEQPFSPRTYQPGTISFLYGNNTQLDLNEDNQFVNSILSPIDIKEHRPTNGEMIIFPSYLIHYVSPFYTEGVERISVSGNVSIIETKIKTII